MTIQKPTVGAIVHYVSYGTPGGEYVKHCRAAIVTEVKGNAISPAALQEVDAYVVSLAVFNPEGMYFNQTCVQMEDHHDGGTWHWLEGCGR